MQVLHKLAHKMQVGIPVAYNVCEVELDKINQWFTYISWANLCKTCILKLGSDDNLDEVETCRPSKLNS